MSITGQELVERIAVLEEKCEQIIREKRERVIVEKHTDKMLNSMNTKLEKTLTRMEILVERADKKDKSDSDKDKSDSDKEASEIAYKRRIFGGVIIGLAMIVANFIYNKVMS